MARASARSLGFSRGSNSDVVWASLSDFMPSQLSLKKRMNDPEKINLRQATISDLEILEPLFDAYRQFYRKPADLDLARQFLRERFQHNQSIIFLALQGDSGIGFTQLYPSYSSASAARILILNDLFVAPQARRKRVGSMLLAAAARFGEEIGVVRLTLTTEATNTQAQALYESEGWVQQTDFYTYNLALPPAP
ncbi:MAG TPA: GNAT family N-acetyltransferase [Bryobacteraceae bacterium]|nr:GNAT family N-acetyltransferase [Bryobacteraceae bacterium]